MKHYLLIKSNLYAIKKFLKSDFNLLTKRNAMKGAFMKNVFKLLSVALISSVPVNWVRLN